MEFVLSASNLRAYAFSLPLQNWYFVKKYSGRMFNAISSSNAVVGGILAMKVIEVLQYNIKEIQFQSEVFQDVFFFLIYFFLIYLFIFFF